MAPDERAGQAARHRVFFALWGTEDFCQRLRAASAPLLAAVPGRPVVPADWHVTLCFLGEVDAQRLGALQAGAGKIDARGFTLQFDGIEYWQRSRVIAVTAAAVPQPALDLAAALRSVARAAALTPDERALRPHVTLMRGVSARAWWGRNAGAPEAGRMAAAQSAALRPGGPVDLALEACELRLAQSNEPAQAPPALPGGRCSAPGWPDGARRYATLARWLLRP